MKETAKIKPALSAGEWATRRGRYPDGDVAYTGRAQLDPDYDLVVTTDEGSTTTVPIEELPAILALANDALPDDSPYKITREDIQLLLRANYAPEDMAGFLALRAKLAALLPAPCAVSWR